MNSATVQDFSILVFNFFFLIYMDNITQEICEKVKRIPQGVLADRGRAAANVLTPHINLILAQIKKEGLSDSDIGAILREVIVDLRATRQNVLRFKKIEK